MSLTSWRENEEAYGSGIRSFVSEVRDSWVWLLEQEAADVPGKRLRQHLPSSGVRSVHSALGEEAVKNIFGVPVTSKDQMPPVRTFLGRRVVLDDKMPIGEIVMMTARQVVSSDGWEMRYDVDGNSRWFVIKRHGRVEIAWRELRERYEG